MIPSDFATDFATGAANVAVLVFWFCAAFPICITIHELGHALAAEVVGLRVIGFGIGEHSPFFSIPVFGARFFLARPFGGGFTLVVDEAIRSPPWKMVVTTAAGPIASLLLCWFATTGLIQIGYHPLFLGVAVMSARDFFASVIPRRFRASGRWGLNDAALILHTLREEEFRVMLPGKLPALGSVTARLLPATAARGGGGVLHRVGRLCPSRASGWRRGEIGTL